ncbi:MAG: hypothetical protein N3A38_06695 [Planctomycetota bacterium]|nr:hypothetical protein [Planctomycetota bacterium]
MRGIRCAVMCVAVAIVFVCSEALAQCPLSGGGKGGGCPLSGRTASGGGGCGGRGIIGGGGGGGAKKATAKKPQQFQKWALPPEAALASFDTGSFDAAAESLGLSEEQKKKVDALKAEVRAELDRLAKAQKIARAAYEKAPACQMTCTELYRSVMSAASACKAFDPNARFKLGLQNILTAEQWKKYTSPSDEPRKSDVKDEAA